MKKEARGRGNQGDWHNPRAAIGTLPQHEEHNAAVEAKRQLRKRSNKHRRNQLRKQRS